MSLPMRPGDAVDARAGAGGAGFSDADSRWIEAFEAATLRDGAFHHRDHVRTAWIYLRRFPPAAALDRFARGLRRFAAEKGKPGLYHETITWAYLLLIRERMESVDPRLLLPEGDALVGSRPTRVRFSGRKRGGLPLEGRALRTRRAESPRR
jgi:hypothetical protein